jgi:hypothetical protein
MVGLPGQSLRDLAGDIRFFKQLNANMIGMGPYITGDSRVTVDLFLLCPSIMLVNSRTKA